MSSIRCGAVLAVCLAGGAWAQPFTVVHRHEAPASGLLHTTYVVQNGANTANRFGVEHVVIANGLVRHLAAPIILMPSFGDSAEEYLSGDEAGDFQSSVAANLAKSGLDVYVYSPREALLAPGQCDDQAACSAAAGWGFQAILDDLAFIRALSAREHPHRKPVIGGYSMGGVVGFAAVNQLPDAYAGLLLSDSPAAIPDAGGGPGFRALCQGLTAAVAANQYVDSSLASLLVTLATLERTAPNDPTPIPLFPPGITNRQAYLLFLTTPSAGPPASVFATGVILATGDFLQDRLFIASEARANALVLAVNPYIPNAVFRDLTCIAGGAKTFTSNLHQYDGPILAFELGKGYGAMPDATIALTSSRDVDVVSLPDYGHVDLLASPDHRRLYEDRIVQWVYGDTVSR